LRSFEGAKAAPLRMTIGRAVRGENFSHSTY
jgi:hypothetical protein